MTSRIGKGALLRAVHTAPSLPPTGSRATPTCRRAGSTGLASGRPVASSGWTQWLCQPCRASMRSERRS